LKILLPGKERGEGGGETVNEGKAPTSEYLPNGICRESVGFSSYITHNSFCFLSFHFALFYCCDFYACLILNLFLLSLLLSFELLI